MDDCHFGYITKLKKRKTLGRKRHICNPFLINGVGNNMWICGLGSWPKLIVSTQGSKAFQALEQLHHLLAQYSSDATQHLYTNLG